MVFNRDFDRRYQVTRMNGGASDRRYTRDKNGRVTGITNVRTPSLAGLNAALGYAGKSNRLEKISGAGAGRYAYDANGNTLSDGRHAFTYDALNRLVSVSVQNTVKARYTYDAWNRRTSKTAGGRTIHYHYDQDSRLIGESLANGTVLREYVYLRGEPVALLEYETRPGWYFYVTDHLGTPQQLVDSRGAVVWQAAYLPYGEAKVLKATVQNNLRFPGQYFDAETGLHYNWNRYYNPKTGRYITADPIGLVGGMNVYAYTGGNPVNWIDVYGLFTLADAENSLKKRNIIPGDKGILWDSYTDTQIFDEWLKMEKSLGAWWEATPKCPEKICVGEDGKATNPDSGTWSNPNVGFISGLVLNYFHNGASYELRSLAGKSGSPHGNQCTYDKNGNLIKNMPAAGSADLYGPNNDFRKHQDHDVATYKLADKLKRVEDYYSVRPIW